MLMQKRLQRWTKKEIIKKINEQIKGVIRPPGLCESTPAM